jgi:hypothetical protein
MLDGSRVRYCLTWLAIVGSAATPTLSPCRCGHCAIAASADSQQACHERPCCRKERSADDARDAACDCCPTGAEKQPTRTPVCQCSHHLRPVAVQARPVTNDAVDSHPADGFVSHPTQLGTCSLVLAVASCDRGPPGVPESLRPHQYFSVWRN